MHISTNIADKVEVMKVCAIILAAGKGSRFQGQKQFLEFHGKTLWKHLYDNVTEIIPEECVVVVGVDIEGGSTRSGSVKKGLEWIKSHGGCDKVLVLEAARCMVSRRQLQKIIETKAESICYVNPVVDTVILKDRTYLNRSDCFSLVSPQAFVFDLLYDAYIDTDLSEIRTDDTRLMYEKYGIKPFFLEGADNLFKVTYPKDIAILEEIYKHIDEY